MTTDELRARFLKFFEERGHRVLAGDPLVPPADDKSLLFTGAGMNAFKNEFLQRVPMEYARAATSQKCLRTGDIEEVGRTDVHHTFFEMLGNFSFNDYFKAEAIEWAWEFVTKVMEIDPKRLIVTVHKTDDEAFELWKPIIGADRIVRLGDKENFWPADAPTKGPNGLCGPCSEIFVDRGEDLSCGHPYCGIECDCAGRRYFEIWNLVFQQFDRKDAGVLEPLPYKNIDTGMGLERAAAVVQGVRSNFDTDVFKRLIGDVGQLLNLDPYADKEVVRRTRRIADHVRAITFCIGDNILPSNQGRGYVLRKLVRTAVRDGVALGREDAFLYSLVGSVTDVMKGGHPDLVTQRERIAKIVRAEEDAFHETLRSGMGMLDGMIDQLDKAGNKVLPGADAFRLFDTYGFPLEVAEQILQERGYGVDREGFELEMERQRETARAGSSIRADIFGSGPLVQLKEKGVTTKFTGYEKEKDADVIVAIVSGNDLMETADEGDDVTIVLNKSPFYAESGGEVGDTGTITSDTGTVDIVDCKLGEGLIVHIGKVRCGRIATGDHVIAEPDLDRRAAIRRNHTATHLLHHALRAVLGEHVTQAGSLVAPERLRFDFTHPESMNSEQLRRVETMVNEHILENAPVHAHETTLDKAREMGAMALFGEKYADDVRMIAVGEISKELCGGLHVRATGDIGLLKILSEGSVASGVRRIEAVTGKAALEHIAEQEDLLARISAALKVPQAKIEERLDGLFAQVKELRAEVKEAAQRGQSAGADDLLGNAKDIGGVKLVCETLPESAAKQIRDIADALTNNKQNVAAVLGVKAGKGAQLVVALTRDLVGRGLNAVDIARPAAKAINGGGGGRPDQAQAGGQNADGIAEALQTASDLIEKALS